MSGDEDAPAQGAQDAPAPAQEKREGEQTARDFSAIEKKLDRLIELAEKNQQPAQGAQEKKEEGGHAAPQEQQINPAEIAAQVDEIETNVTAAERSAGSGTAAGGSRPSSGGHRRTKRRTARPGRPGSAGK